MLSQRSKEAQPSNVNDDEPISGIPNLHPLQIYFPFLPVELEREIFILAFDPFDVAKSSAMMLVAKRIREWIRPLVWQVVYQAGMWRFYSFPYLKRYPCIKLEEIGPFVHHLYLSQPEDDVDQDDIVSFLRNCVNAQNLILSSPMIPGIYKYIEKIPKLRKLSICLSVDDSEVSSTLTELGITGSFAQLTHLRLTNLHNVKEAITTIAKIFYGASCNLSHLGCDQADEWEVGDVNRILASFPSLLAFVLEQEAFTSLPEMYSMHVEDPRIVIFSDDMFYGADDVIDWANDIRLGFDFWDLVDLFVTARRAKYFNAQSSQRYLSEAISRPFNWEQSLTSEGKAWFEQVRLQRCLELEGQSRVRSWGGLFEFESL